MSNYKLLIDGQLVDGDGRFDVINPAIGSVFTQVPHASLKQCEQAISAANTAYPLWSQKSQEERRNLLIILADKIKENSKKLAESIVIETGKPLAEAEAEVMYSEVFIKTQADYKLDVKVLVDNDERRVEEHRKPLGVVAAIIPWNFPLVLAMFKLPPALLAGNTIVIKPAPTTPVTTLMLAQKYFQKAL